MSASGGKMIKLSMGRAGCGSGKNVIAFSNICGTGTPTDGVLFVSLQLDLFKQKDPIRRALEPQYNHLSANRYRRNSTENETICFYPRQEEFIRGRTEKNERKKPSGGLCVCKICTRSLSDLNALIYV